MIERLQRIASLLNRLRALIVLLAAGFLLLLVAALFEIAGVSYDALLVPAVIGFAWSATLYSFSGLFARVPERPGPGTPLLRRLRISSQRAMIWVLAILMLALTIALLMLSSQMLRSWSSG